VLTTEELILAGFSDVSAFFGDFAELTIFLLFPALLE
jgi:hypothetical protein